MPEVAVRAVVVQETAAHDTALKDVNAHPMSVQEMLALRRWLHASWLCGRCSRAPRMVKMCYRFPADAATRKVIASLDQGS